MQGPKFSSLFFLCLGLLATLQACSSFAHRPSRQMSYAEAAYQSAALAGAETTQPNLFQMSKDALMQARAAYRLKNFKLARQLALKARLAAEDAEYKALVAAANPPSPATPAAAPEEKPKTN